MTEADFDRYIAWARRVYGTPEAHKQMCADMAVAGKRLAEACTQFREAMAEAGVNIKTEPRPTSSED